MRPVIINARFLTQPITGVQRFAIEISKLLRTKLPHAKFICPHNILHTELASYLQAEPIGKLKSHFWEQLELPLYLRKNNSPLLINLGNTAPLLYSNQIVSILDLSFLVNPKWFSKTFAAYYSFVIPRIARNSHKIVTISENSKKDLRNILGIPKEKIEVLYCSLPDQFKKNDLTPTINKYGRYILAVSSLDPRKNFINLIKAFLQAQLPDTRLVIVGSENKVFADQNIKELVQNNNTVVFTGYITDDELKSLYSNALLFLYPSLYEGFGLPPLEAMACGCPTIVSNVASLPEVCGDATYYVDPTSVDNIAQGIKKVAQDKNLRDSLIIKGKERIYVFDWAKSAQKLVDLIHTTL